MPTRYSVVLPQPCQARGSDDAFSFRGHSPATFADLLTTALRDPAWFERWRNTQADPKTIDPGLAGSDPQVQVFAQLDEPRIKLEIHTTLSSKVVCHRLALLAGRHWQLHDVR